MNAALVSIKYFSEKHLKNVIIPNFWPVVHFQKYILNSKALSHVFP